MSRRARIALIVGGSLAALLLVLVVAGFFVLRSDWFHGKVRERIVAEVEKATGGTAEIGEFKFDWKKMRAEIHGFVLRGTEGAGKPPLFRADSIAIELKILKLLRPDVDLRYLEVIKPQAYLIIHPDGTTNVPEPKVQKTSDKTVVQTLLDLAIDRFNLENGSFEIEARGKTPFSGKGENLKAHFDYETGAPQYRGELSMDPLHFQWGEYQRVPLAVNLSVALERNRIVITGARLATGHSKIELSGVLDDIESPRGVFQYKADLDLGEVARILKVSAIKQGSGSSAGEIRLVNPSQYEVTGKLHAVNTVVSAGATRLRNLKADAGLHVAPAGIELRNLRFSGVAVTAADRQGKELRSVPASGRATHIQLEGDDLRVSNLRLDALGGTFTGNAGMRDFSRFHVEGSLRDFEIGTLVSVMGSERVPWNGQMSGPVKIEGSTRDTASIRASTRLNITPTGDGQPLSGYIQADYDGRRGILDLGRSFIQLPSTRLSFSGAIGNQLKVHLESTDLVDFKPAINIGNTGPPRKIPMELKNGSVVFDGTVTGKLENLQVTGHLSARRVAYEGRVIDSFNTDVALSRSNASLQNASAVSGKLRADLSGAVALQDWKAADSSAVTALASIRNAAVADLAALGGQKEVPATGVLNASARVSGTVGDPRVALELSAVKGSLYQEPFDRLTAKVSYAGQSVELGSAELVAGQKKIDLNARFEHAPGDFRKGKVTFEVASNRLALQDIHRLRKERPGISGTVQLKATGAVELSPGPAGKTDFQIAALDAKLDADGLQMNEQQLGNANLTARTEQGALVARLESNFAQAEIRGEGRWKLAGDYPGSASVQFTRLDFGRLQDWLAPPKPGEEKRVAGFAEGQVTLEGPALKPELWEAALRVPKFAIGPVLEEGSTATQHFTLRNEGPIVVRMERSVVRVESARLVGRGTDIQVTGTVSPKEKTPLDLKVNGKLDLATLQDFREDLVTSGSVLADATIRGAFGQPQVAGRMELKEASFNILDVPNGIDNASGVILFTGQRATIQNLTGESGGGKISLAGFVGYGKGMKELVFRLHMGADSVRVRYPEGVSTLADASLDFTGTTDRSMLAGAVTILRTGFNPQSDFSSLLAKSAEPVRTPAARTGFLAGLNFDITIQTSPDITFSSTLAQDLQAEANLRLRGTASNPALLGRININQGELGFFGTKYNISQGSIAFYNPVRIEPVLNIDLETRARGIDVTVTVSGPINKLNLTPRSDPPLQFSEIVALLATGRTPTSDPTLMARQSSTTPQTWQQMGASALLGQAIANPVAGRLQRFFGVTKLKIDPSLQGVENNPQARLTLEQQVTRDITFTYITNVTNSNPLVVRVEWAVNKQWSVIALREENGLFGVDFRFKKRFR